MPVNRRTHSPACKYQLAESVITFTHTVVEPAFEGAGVRSALANHVLDDCRGKSLKVIPAGALIKDYIAKHLEYADLLAE
jgi:uncharacterized protein